jgi:hypothetical protein
LLYAGYSNGDIAVINSATMKEVVKPIRNEKGLILKFLEYDDRFILCFAKKGPVMIDTSNNSIYLVQGINYPVDDDILDI